jgi:hypothetical protein
VRELLAFAADRMMELEVEGPRRYEKGAMLVTSNRSVGEWDTVFGDPVVATAILDRLLHHAHVITIRGESYRLKEKRRSGLLQKTTAASTQPKRGRSSCRNGAHCLILNVTGGSA